MKNVASTIEPEKACTRAAIQQQIDKLRKQSSALHEVIDQYVLQVKKAAKAWLENSTDCQLSFQNVKEELEKSVLLVKQTADGVSSAGSECVKPPLKARAVHKGGGGRKQEAKSTTNEEAIFVKEKYSKSTGKKAVSSTSLACDVCQRQFSSQPKLSAHRRRHFYEFQYRCLECNRKFQFKSQLGRHKLSHTGEKAFKCEYCGKLFQGRQGMEKHQEKHLPVRPEYKCDICEKVLGSKNYLQRHKRIHKEDNPFTCEVCGKGCIDGKTLHEHARTHTGEKPFRCDICNNSFTRKSYLNQHIKVVHNRENRFQCDECGKKFVDKWYLSIHKQLHKPETPYLCDYCGKGYKNKYTLKSHKQTHTDVDPFICDVCGKGFKIKGGLKEHRKSHSEEKPHTCEVCGKSFRDKNQLSSHKWVHEEERPFKCEVCGKSFPWQGRLDLHKRIHSAERPFKCDVCGKGFKRRNDITKHKLKVHGQKKFGSRKLKQNLTSDENQAGDGVTDQLFDSSSVVCSSVNDGSRTQPLSTSQNHNAFSDNHIDDMMPSEVSRPLESVSGPQYTDIGFLSGNENPSVNIQPNDRPMQLQPDILNLRPVQALGSEQSMQTLGATQNLSTALDYDPTVEAEMTNRRTVEKTSYQQQSVLEREYDERYVYGPQHHQQHHHNQNQVHQGDHVPVYHELHVLEAVDDQTSQQNPSPFQSSYSSSLVSRHTGFIPVPPQGVPEEQPQQTVEDKRSAPNALFGGPPVPYPWNSMYRDKY